MSPVEYKQQRHHMLLLSKHTHYHNSLVFHNFGKIQVAANDYMDRLDSAHTLRSIECDIVRENSIHNILCPFRWRYLDRTTKIAAELRWNLMAKVVQNSRFRS